VKPSRTGIRFVPVPGNDIAEALGNARMANVVLLGAYLVATNMLPVEAVETALDQHLGKRQRKYLEANKEALRRGVEYAQGLVLAHRAQQGG
jgi:2-oxoglutarate ferredoxin oxidoreductase subunit gamma